MGTVQHRQTFIAEYRVYWFVSSIETGRFAERGKPGNSILQQCSNGTFSSDKRWSRDKIQTYLYSVTFELFCISFLCVCEPMLMCEELFCTHPTRICVLCLVKCNVSLLEIHLNYFTSTTTMVHC